MSRILKRPMFRKGGEVMEGIMTGIKPRENFQDKGMSNDMLSSIRGKIDLIDAVSGAGGQDNLSNLLISGGMNLLSGENEGDNVLQTLAGAYKQPTQQLFASQARDRSGKRAIAASLISKMGTGGLEKFRGIARDLLKQESYQKKYGTDANAINKLAGDLFEKDQYRKPVSPDEAAYQQKKARVEGFQKKKNIFKESDLGTLEASELDKGISRVENNEDLSNRIDLGQPYFPKNVDYESGASVKIQGKDARVLIPDDKDPFTSGKIYYNINERAWFVYDGDAGQLTELPGI